MKLSCSVLFVLFSLTTQSQNKNVLIKFCPLALGDEVSFPTIQAGLEFKLHNKLTWYTELGIKYRKSYYEKADTNFLKSNGIKIKTEIRYYFKNKRGLSFKGSYFAANAFFTMDLHNTQIGYYAQNDSSAMKTDVFGVKKNVFGLNFVYGYQRFHGRFAIDVYGGLGIRFRNINSTNKEYNKTSDAFFTPIDFNIDANRKQIDANGGFTVAPNLTLGIRICYQLNRILNN